MHEKCEVYVINAPMSISEQVENRLSTYLGRHNAKTAVKTFSMRVLNRGPETLTREDLPTLLEALRPMLRTLVGGRSAELLLTEIKLHAE